ncbi:L,D-transpeptidase [Pseudonocardia sp. KRD-182]|nr:L,D-transpeptidase [Pseudonocardia oceani]
MGVHTRATGVRASRIAQCVVGAAAVVATVLVISGPATAAPSAQLVPGTPCTTTARACVDLAAASAWLIADGSVTYGPVPIASGPPEAETPKGTTVVDWKSRYHHSREFGGVAMHYAVFFAPGGIAVHEGVIDHPSAGCVRLETEAASRFFDTLAVGDEVQVR